MWDRAASSNFADILCSSSKTDRKTMRIRHVVVSRTNALRQRPDYNSAARFGKLLSGYYRDIPGLTGIARDSRNVCFCSAVTKRTQGRRDDLSRRVLRKTDQRPILRTTDPRADSKPFAVINVRSSRSTPETHLSAADPFPEFSRGRRERANSSTRNVFPAIRKSFVSGFNNSCIGRHAVRRRGERSRVRRGVSRLKITIDVRKTPGPARKVKM